MALVATEHVIKHMSLDIGGVLANWPLRKLKRMLKDAKTGRSLTAQEAKVELLRLYGEGVRFLSMSPGCEGFDPTKGCPGHNPKELTRPPE